MTDRRTRQRTGQRHEVPEGVVHGVKRRLTSPQWLARAAGVCLSGVSIGFVVLFVFIVETAGDLALITRPLPMRIALALPYLVATLAVGTAAGTLLAWRYRYWTRPVRIHQTVLTLLGLAFSWQLWTLGFLSV